VPDLPLCRRSPGRSLRSLPPFGVRHGWSLQEAPKGIVASPLDGDTPTLGLARAPASGLTNGAAAPHLPLGLSRACVFFSRGGGGENKRIRVPKGVAGEWFWSTYIHRQPSDWDEWCSFHGPASGPSKGTKRWPRTTLRPLARWTSWIGPFFVF
jgi:hypothetical protein